MEKTQKTPNKKKTDYYCKKCDFRCCNKKDFKRHKMTAKCLKGKHGNIKSYSVEFFCDTCGKGYKHRSGLSRHKKKCKFVKNEFVEKKGERVIGVTHVTQKNDNIKKPKKEKVEKKEELEEKIELLEEKLIDKLNHKLNF